MTAAPSAIRDSLKTALETISGLRVYDTIPGTINVPCVIVEPDDPYVTYDQTLDGLATLRFTLLLLVQLGNDRTAQDNLDGYIVTSGATSVPAAVSGRLASTVADARVVEVSRPKVESYNGVDYLAVEFSVVVEQ